MSMIYVSIFPFTRKQNETLNLFILSADEMIHIFIDWAQIIAIALNHPLSLVLRFCENDQAEREARHAQVFLHVVT